MEYSKNFEFALPSSNNDVDLADINEIANNFRKIDENAVKKEEGKGLSTNDFSNKEKEKVENSLTAEDIDQNYNPESENAQSGIAVAQALKGASGGSGIKVITEEVNAGKLDYGIYYIDGNNGGWVNLPKVAIDTTFSGGMIFVSPNADFGGKQVNVFAISSDVLPVILTYTFDEDGNYMDIYNEFVSKTYVDAHFTTLQRQIDELATMGTSADGTVYRPFVEELDSNIEVADYSAELV